MFNREKILNILHEANGIDQTISTIGLKKVPVDKYILFQKGQTIDFCVLQQNAFHNIDACTRPDRLMVINEAVQKLIDSSVDFSDEGTDDEEIKELVRAKFDELRQWWRDWNSSAATGEAVSALPAKIEQFILQKEPAL